MPGGLLQVVSLGEQDRYLQLQPQVSFFRQVHKRHTPFSTEIVEEALVGQIDFSETVTCDLSRVGDLVHTIYLKVELPAISAARTSTVLPTQRADAVAKLTAMQTLYSSFKEMLSLAFTILKTAKQYAYTYGMNYNGVMTQVTETKNLIAYNAKMRQFESLAIQTTKPFLPLTPVSPKYTLNPGAEHIILIHYLDIVTTMEDMFTTIDGIKTYIANFESQAKALDKIIFDEIQDANKRVLELTNGNDVIAWGKEIGNLLINKIEIEIGGKVIDTIDKHLLSVYASLRHDPIQAEHYKKMIGDIEEMTKAASHKGRRLLLIPIPFWFCRYPGVSLPSVFLKHHTTRVSITFENFFRCTFNAPTDSTARLASASLLVSYMFLDQAERELFGNMKHSYLIEQHQDLLYTDIPHKQFSVETVLFNPVKEMIWLVQSTNNLAKNFHLDYSGSAYHKVTSIERLTVDTLKIGVNGVLPTKIKSIELCPGNEQTSIVSIQGSFITLKTTYQGNGSELYVRCIICDNPVATSWIEINGVRRFLPRDATSANAIQPYQHHNATPKDGVNLYSFCLHPDEFQPSGFINMTRVDLKTLNIVLDDTYYKWLQANSDTAVLRVYARNMNLLRFEYGKAFVTFNV